MNRKLQPILLALLVILAAPLGAQKILKKADKQFELRAYDLAIHNYIKLLQEDPANADHKRKLAECYRLTNRPIDASSWYKKIINDADVSPQTILNYAHTLKKIGKYADAQALYVRYKETDPLVGGHFALGCDFAKNLLFEEENYDLALLSTNSKASDFGVSFFDNNVVFSSFKRESSEIKGTLNASHVSKSTNRLFIAEGELPKKDAKSLLLRGELKERSNIGPISFAEGETMCAYTKNYFSNGQPFVVDGDMDMSIFLASVSYDGDFDNEVPFAHNELGYSTGFPCLSFHKGTAMYFSSNRPGGFGGFDLYVSYYNDGEWSYPENLGNQINSVGNEITPSYDGNTLYFASDYHQGLGGYDLFKATAYNGEWSYPENMGKGLNSPADDYFPAKLIGSENIYFTSNRMGGRGKDDIYVASPKMVIEPLYTENEESIYIPKAVSLADLDPFKGNNGQANSYSVNNELKKEQLADIASQENSEISNTENSLYDPNNPPPVYRVESETLKTKSRTHSLSKARRVAHGEIIKTSSNVYFIQLAAIFNSDANVSPFQNLVRFGNIYKVYKSNSIKIRLGYYLDRDEAAEVLQQVRKSGFEDAFITYEALNTSQLELAISSYDSGKFNQTPPSSEENYPDYENDNLVEYKVRLASYEDPIWFDVNKVKDIGQIEQWTKSGWTIFVLSGFKTKEEAERANIQALNRGFSDSEVVIDNNGILERIVHN